MADYIYLLENRLSVAQQNALSAVREVARAKGLTIFLVGGAVRDLTSGSPVRDLDVAVQGNALKLKKDFEKAGATISGEHDPAQALFLRFPGGVRMEVSSTLSVHYPKPGKPVVKPATILDDLRRRDFTANAMALSLNQGSYGLLMDPLNGVADIENRELRLVSNYGFIEDPVRMVRAARLSARLGWQLEDKTQTRYETGKSEDYISAMQEFHRGYEAEEIVHEEDPLRVLRRLEADGWMKHLAPAWASAKANVAELEKLREAQMQLSMQGIHADPSAAQFPLLTAKLSPKDIASLKAGFPRKGFVAEIETLEADARQFAAELSSKAAAVPSAAWKMIFAARPEVVLWVAYSTKSAALQAKFKSFYTEWPQARQKVPYVLMQEMRILPELAGFDALVETLVFELMDSKLGTVEEMRAFLAPYSPPAPPPPVSMRRARAAKKEVKATKARKKPESEDLANGTTGSAAAVGTDTDGSAAPPAPSTPAGGSEPQAGNSVPPSSTVKKVAAPAAPLKGQPERPAAAKAVPVKSVPASPAAKPGSSAKSAAAAVKPAGLAAKAAAAKPAPSKGARPPANLAKSAAKTPAPVKAPAQKIPAKAPIKAALKKSSFKAPGKAASKSTTANLKFKPKAVAKSALPAKAAKRSAPPKNVRSAAKPPSKAAKKSVASKPAKKTAGKKR